MSVNYERKTKDISVSKTVHKLQKTTSIEMSKFPTIKSSFFTIDNKEKKYVNMADYCFDIFYKSKLKREQQNNNLNGNRIQHNYKINPYELLKNVKKLARRDSNAIKLKELSKEEDAFFESNINSNINKKDSALAFKGPRASVNSMNSKIDTDFFTPSKLRNYSLSKVDNIFDSYFRNIDPDSEEIKEVLDSIHAYKVASQKIILTSKYFNHTCEKFKPKINLNSKALIPKQKHFIIRGITKSQVPCKIPADYLERRKLFNSILFSNQKIIKAYQAIPKRDIKLLTIKEVCDLINKITDESFEKVYLCFHYLVTNLKFNIFDNMQEFYSIFHQQSSHHDDMNRTGFNKKESTAGKDKMNKTFHKNKANSNKVNINEELDKLINKDHTWRIGTTYCSGFVSIFCEMLGFIGFSNEQYCRIQGFYKPSMSQELKKTVKLDFANAIPNHEWLRVKLFDNWYFIDPSLGTGYFNYDGSFNEEFNPFYFFIPGNILIDTHLPLKEENQFLMKAIKPSEFITTHPIDYKLFYDAVFKYNFIPIQPYLPFVLMLPNSTSNIILELPYLINFELYDIENVKMTIEKNITSIRSGNSYSIQVFKLELIGVYTLIVKAQLDSKSSVMTDILKLTIVVSPQI